jgi:hypothetical protein
LRSGEPFWVLHNLPLTDHGAAAIDESEEPFMEMPAPRRNRLPWFVAALAIALAANGVIGWWKRQSIRAIVRHREQQLR